MLEVLDLSHNKFAGDIWNITDNFCALIPKGGSLKELRLNHNKFTGQIPPCLMQFERLNFLALNDNRFHGALPEIEASQLVILTLHKNALTGVLPKTLYTLAYLGVLTLHENSIGGGLSRLNLSVPCLDNSKFRLFGMLDCRACGTSAFQFPGDMLQQIKVNCPQTLDACPHKGMVNLTLHHNRFSCAVPESLGNNEVSGLVIMGNMLGNGSLLNAPWISREEQQLFLYYSPQVWKSTILVLTGFLLLMTSAALCRRKLQTKLEETSLGLTNDIEARVVASNLALMKAAVSTLLLASPLLLIFGLGGKYYDCSPLLWQTTAANFSAEGWCAQFGVIVLWCAMQVLFRCILAGIIKPRRSHRKAVRGCKKRITRVTAWVMWICIVTLLSLPSIFFTFAQSIPAQNTWDLSEAGLTFFHATAPVQTVLIDMVLAVPLSSKFSKLTGLKADRLLMTFRLFSAWLLAALTTTALDENCLSGWKLAWKVCEEGSKENSKFNWKIYDEELLNTTRDICTFTETWWSDGRCSRAIVGGLTPFLLKKLLTRSMLQPLVLWTMWHFSQLEPAGDPREGRHCRLFGVWPKSTKSLIPLQQMALLTTQMEVLMFWSPYVPLLSLGILAAAVTNFLMFDLGIRFYKVELPSDEVNEVAALSASYLYFALGAGSLFQLWHAFSTRMCGRYFLLAVHLAIMGPWANVFLPVGFIKRRFWTSDDMRERELMEMTSMD
ncbi:LRR receptor-like serine/threonine-protein kinase ERL2 (Protein ERECTA-like kinase 2) [Durusdinium trenchii]|uniref:LRR receptor-like serine/threonine-protein kinase ERL2 (Protein ERECTA-like kinase 2) n=1 Tax=Durusdinium trenchii TaxID=1381693 RepID=A0ABP0LMA0_9DINO